MIRLFDAHCHVARNVVPGDGITPEESPVRGRVLCGVGPADWDTLAAVAADWPGSVAAFGLHPWNVAETKGDWLERLERRLTADPGAWLGEAGLDGLKAGADGLAPQIRALEEQLRLARKLDRNINLHCVKAAPELLASLEREYLRDGPRTFVMHSFAGPYQFVDKFAECGAYFSVGGLFSRRNSRKDRERVGLFPEDRLLLESDAFLRPGTDDVDGLSSALEWLAEVRAVPVASLAEIVANNARRVFPL